MLGPLVSKLNEMRVVLASSSKQRANLLGSTNVKFQIESSNFEENLDPRDYTHSDFVEKTALGKLTEVYERLETDPLKKPDLVIGADTMVIHNGKMYGKPKDKKDAFQTIKDLTQSGLPNSVYTGVVLRYKDEIHKFTEVTTVHMVRLTDEEITAYVDSGEPMGKAGGYGIQGIASTFVQRIEGDGNNVIGLPLCRLAQELKRIVMNDE